MNEIDVSKCEFYCSGICEEYEEYGVYLCCKDKPYCHYRQLQQLKINNENLKQCLDEIEHILEINKRELEECLSNDIDGQILQLIKQTKEGE